MTVKQQLVEPEVSLEKSSGLSMISQKITNENFVPFTPKKKIVKSWDFFEVDMPMPSSKKTVEKYIVGFQLKTVTEHYAGQHYGIFKEAPPLKFETSPRIPSDLVPEVAAVSITAILSLIGVLVAIVFASAPTLFLAPLMASLVAGVFLWKTIRNRRI
jgi:hypothetical protein